MLEYVLVFVLLALTGFGLPVPEESVLLLAAYFVTQGSSFGVLVALCVLAIALSDTVHYVKGRLRSRAFTQFKKGKLFISNAGFFAVFTARFFIASRVVMPFMAGAMRMRRASFHAASILGALVLSVALIIFGSLLYGLVSRLTDAAPILWTALIVVVTGVLVMYATRSQVRMLQTTQEQER